jgi:hypothetical protein
MNSGVARRSLSADLPDRKAPMIVHCSYSSAVARRHETGHLSRTDADERDIDRFDGESAERTFVVFE